MCDAFVGRCVCVCDYDMGHCTAAGDMFKFEYLPLKAMDDNCVPAWFMCPESTRVLDSIMTWIAKKKEQLQAAQGTPPPKVPLSAWPLSVYVCYQITKQKKISQEPWKRSSAKAKPKGLWKRGQEVLLPIPDDGQRQIAK